MKEIKSSIKTEKFESDRLRNSLRSEADSTSLDCTVTKDEKLVYSSKYKLILSGPVVELYEYQYPIRLGFDTSKYKKGVSEESERNEEYRQRTATNARNNIRRLALNNFSNKDKFFTLTFDPKEGIDVKDISVCNTEFKKFIQRLKHKFGVLGYLAVIQFQKNGNIHYHLLINLPYVEQFKLEEIWTHGIVNIQKLSSVDNVGAYITHYMSKTLDDPRLKGQKCYFTSKGLNRSQTVYGKEAENLIQALNLSNKSETYRNSYHSELNGLVIYKEYNSNKNISYSQKHDN